jgi:hypothetical protein
MATYSALDTDGTLIVNALSGVSVDTVVGATQAL